MYNRATSEDEYIRMVDEKADDLRNELELKRYIVTNPTYFPPKISPDQDAASAKNLEFLIPEGLPMTTTKKGFLLKGSTRTLSVEFVDGSERAQVEHESADLYQRYCKEVFGYEREK